MTIAYVPSGARQVSVLAARVAGLYDHIGQFVEPVSLLVARVAVASVFWRSSQTKIADWSNTIDLFRDVYSVPVLPPEIAAYLGTAVEVGGSVALALGLLSRPAALALLGLVAIIQTFVFPENWPDHILWAGLLLTVVARGPGPIALDRLVSRALLRR
jgi:putative oxidoreductase